MKKILLLTHLNAEGDVLLGFKILKGLSEWNTEKEKTFYGLHQLMCLLYMYYCMLHTE